MKMKNTKTEGGPMSSAGIVRYFDVSGGGVQISPEIVVGVAVAFILLEMALFWLI